MELLLLLGAGGLGLWAILSEPIRETRQEWALSQQDAEAQALEAARTVELEEIHKEMAHAHLLIEDPRTPHGHRLEAVEYIDRLEINKSQLLAEDLVPR